jgi:circadian clock protein KaiB
VSSKPPPTLEPSQYVLRLFVTGTTVRSARAIENLRRVCEEHLSGEYDLEVVDIYQHPNAAKDYQIVAAPTLVKMLPLPLRRIIGDLADEERVLAGLDISPKDGATLGK